MSVVALVGVVSVPAMTQLGTSTQNAIGESVHATSANDTTPSLTSHADAAERTGDQTYAGESYAATLEPARDPVRESLAAFANTKNPSQLVGPAATMAQGMPENLVAEMMKQTERELGALTAYDAYDVLTSIDQAMNDADYPESAGGFWGWLKGLFGQSDDEQTLGDRLEIAQRKYQELQTRPMVYAPLEDLVAKELAQKGDIAVFDRIQATTREGSFLYENDSPSELGAAFMELTRWAEQQPQNDVNALVDALLNRYPDLANRFGRWTADAVAKGVGTKLAEAFASEAPFRYTLLTTAYASGAEVAKQNIIDLAVCEAVTVSSCQAFRDERGLESGFDPQRWSQKVWQKNMTELVEYWFRVRERSSDYSERYDAPTAGLEAEGVFDGLSDEQSTRLKVGLSNATKLLGFRGLKYLATIAKMEKTTVQGLFTRDLGDDTGYVALRVRDEERYLKRPLSDEELHQIYEDTVSFTGGSAEAALSRKKNR